MELALKEASDQAALAAQDNVSLRETGKAQAERLDAALRRIAEVEATSERDKQRTATLEQALADEQGAHANLRAKHLDHVERTRAEISALANSVHAVRGRVDVTNKLLDQTRAQFRDKVEELRAAERHAPRMRHPDRRAGEERAGAQRGPRRRQRAYGRRRPHARACWSTRSTASMKRRG